MNLRSLRFRLVLWHALWLTIVFVVTGTILYLGLRHNLAANLIRMQERRAIRLAAVAVREEADPQGNLKDEIKLDFAPEATGRFIRILRSEGKVVYQSGVPSDLSFDPALISPGPHPEGSRWERPGAPAEMAIVTVPSDRQHPPRFLVETGESLGPSLKELNRLLVSLGLVFAVVTGIAMVGGTVLVRRVLRPVDEIARSAERITSRNSASGSRSSRPATSSRFCRRR